MKNWNSRFEASERWLHTIKGHWTLAAWTFHISIQGVILWTLNWPLSSVKPILGKINLKNPIVFICFCKFHLFKDLRVRVQLNILRIAIPRFAHWYRTFHLRLCIPTCNISGESPFTKMLELPNVCEFIKPKTTSFLISKKISLLANSGERNSK